MKVMKVTKKMYRNEIDHKTKEKYIIWSNHFVYSSMDPNLIDQVVVFICIFVIIFVNITISLFLIYHMRKNSNPYGKLTSNDNVDEIESLITKSRSRSINPFYTKQI